MPLNTDALDRIDKMQDGPGFDKDEFVSMRGMEDAVTYMEALNDSFEPDPKAENPDEAPMRANNAVLNRERVRRMVTNWNLWKPATADDLAAGRTKGEQILYLDDKGNPSAANFDIVYRMLGRWLLEKVNAKSGTTVPKIDKGVVDPNTGEPASFLESGANGSSQRVAGPVGA